MDDPIPIKRGRSPRGTFVTGEPNGGRVPLIVAEPKVREQIIKFVQLGARRTQACAAVGVHRKTLIEWTKKGKEGREPWASFMADLDEAEAYAEMRLLSLWSTHAQTNWQAARDLLKVRFRERWSDEAAVAEVETIAVAEPETGVEHLSEMMAAFEEAGRAPQIAKGDE